MDAARAIGCSTPSYASPEQVSGRPAVITSDVYGKTGYAALAESLGRDDERTRVAALRLADLYDDLGDAERAAYYRR